MHRHKRWAFPSYCTRVAPVKRLLTPPPADLLISSPFALMLAVRVSTSAVSCALLLIIICTPWRRRLFPAPLLSGMTPSERLMLLLLLRRAAAAAAGPINCLALPLPTIAVFDVKVGTNATTRQAVERAAIVATAVPRDNMRKRCTQHMCACGGAVGIRGRHADRIGQFPCRYSYPHGGSPSCNCCVCAVYVVPQYFSQ